MIWTFYLKEECPIANSRNAMPTKANKESEVKSNGEITKRQTEDQKALKDLGQEAETRAKADNPISEEDQMQDE